MPLLDPSMFSQQGGFNQQALPGWLMELLANGGAMPFAGGPPPQQQQPGMPPEMSPAMQANASGAMPPQAPMPPPPQMSRKMMGGLDGEALLHSLNQPQPGAMPPGGAGPGGMPMPPPQMPGPAPQGGGSIFGSLSNGLANNSNMLMGLGAGIMEGGLAKGLKYAMPGAQADQKNRQSRETQNLTVNALIKRGIDPETAKAAASNPALLQNLLKTESGDLALYDRAKKEGYKGSLMDFIAAKRAGAGEYGLNPIWGRDENDNPVMLQAGKSGDAIKSKLPEGVKLSGKEPIKMDAGTHFVLLDPLTRQQVGIIPKNIQGKESAEALGKAQGGAQAIIPQVETTVNNAVATINDLRKHPGLEFGTGLSSIIAGRAYGTSGYDFTAKSQQAQGQAFMAARESLKGAGQVTDFEGKKGEQAIANLDTAQSKEQYLEALNTLERMMKASLSDLKKKAGGNVTSPQASPADGLKSKYGLE